MFHKPLEKYLLPTWTISFVFPLSIHWDKAAINPRVNSLSSISRSISLTQTQASLCALTLLGTYFWRKKKKEREFSHLMKLFSLSLGGVVLKVLLAYSWDTMRQNWGSHGPHLLLMTSSSGEILRKAFLKKTLSYQCKSPSRVYPRDVCWSRDGERWGIVMNPAVMFQEKSFEVIL